MVQVVYRNSWQVQEFIRGTKFYIADNQLFVTGEGDKVVAIINWPEVLSVS